MKDLIIKKDPKTGNLYTRPYLGKNVVTGKPLRPYKSFPDAIDEEEAQRQAEAWAAGISKASDLNVRRRLDDLLPRYVTWLEDMGSPINTVKAYRSSAACLAPYFVGADPDEVSSYDIELVYITLMREGGRRGHPLSPNTVCRHHGFLASAYAWMLSEGICTMTPIPYVHKPSREDPLAWTFSDAELDELLAAIAELMANSSTDEQHVLDRNMACAAYTAAQTGMREGEACGLDRGDVSFRRRDLIVSATAVDDKGRSIRQPKTKGKKIRKLPASEDLLEALRAHMAWQDSFIHKQQAKTKGSAAPLFRDAKGRRIKPSDLSKWFTNLCEALELPPESRFHALRHTFASLLLDQGANLKTIAKLLGHVRDGFTLETYTHMMPERDREAVDAYAASLRQRGRDP